MGLLCGQKHLEPFHNNLLLCVNVLCISKLVVSHLPSNVESF